MPTGVEVFYIFAPTKSNTMKRFLLIFAVMSALISAKAQENEAYVASDTLTYQQLMADYVSLNNQVMQFRTDELVSTGIGLAGAGLAAGGAYLYGKDPENGQVLLICAGIACVTSLVWHIAGLAQIKRDRLKVTSNGVVIKLSKPKQSFEPSLKDW